MMKELRTRHVLRDRRLPKNILVVKGRSPLMWAVSRLKDFNLLSDKLFLKIRQVTMFFFTVL